MNRPVVVDVKENIETLRDLVIEAEAALIRKYAVVCAEVEVTLGEMVCAVKMKKKSGKWGVYIKPEGRDEISIHDVTLELLVKMPHVLEELRRTSKNAHDRFVDETEKTCESMHFLLDRIGT